MLLTLFYFFLALLLLITIHEYGHFLVARLCGVKVLRFSFGFGKVLLRYRDKKGTEFALSAIPFGGYVKMLDENEAPVSATEKHLAFNNQPIFSRIAIVFAGPLFNFIFAWLAFTAVAMIGVISLAPIIDSVTSNSIAAKAGLSAHDEIVAINDYPIHNWQDFQFQIVPKMGTHETIRFTIKNPAHQHRTISFPLTNWQPAPHQDPLLSLGITPFIPKIPAIVGEVVPDSVAEKAGFLKNDKIITVNNQPIHDWITIVDWVKKHPHTPMTLQIKRHQHTQTLSLITATQTVNGKEEGLIGLRSQKMDWPKKWIRFERQSPWQAMTTAFQDTIHLSSSTFMMMGRLFTGQLSIKNISGPIGIAEGAGNSARIGLTAYLSFMALISISLGVLNLLPIPMLDGGHLLYCVIELIYRRPLSDQFKAMGVTIGVCIIGMLMCVAVYNDFTNLIAN